MTIHFSPHKNCIIVVKNGKIVGGMESVFNRLVVEEAKRLETTHNELIEQYGEYAEYYSVSPCPNWVEEAREELILASFRFGDGTIAVEIDEDKEQNV